MSRVVVITGGGTGIGAACARLMAAAGETVFITGRRLAPLQALAEETGAVALAGDAASGDEWQAHLLPTILERAGHIDVLICSAGGMGNGAATCCLSPRSPPSPPGRRPAVTSPPSMQ